MSGIFISYRREDSRGYAGRIYDRLSQHFGCDQVFMDIDSIEPGTDYQKKIQQALESCDVLIAIIGKNWLTVCDKEGQQRIKNSQDLVRIEIQTALRANLTVIPILVEGTTMPQFESLPKPLKPFGRQQAKEISDSNFHRDIDSLISTVERTVQKEKDLIKKHSEMSEDEEEIKCQQIIGNSSAMKSLVEIAQKAAASNATVLILGESGTGKELFARSIHQWSSRRTMPFGVINCLALPDEVLENDLFGYEKGAFPGSTTLKKGIFETTNGGTVYLDEIGAIPANVQSKLLRLLLDREYQRMSGKQAIRVNVRIIAATQDLNNTVKSGAFREDLFFLLDVIRLSIPPLRDRPEDIQLLAESFLKRHLEEMRRPEKHFAPKTIDSMKQYSWPGNVRELDNAIARAVLFGSKDEICLEDLGLHTDNEISK